MKKVLIITEGQTEQIFIKNTLFNLFDTSKFSLSCLKLRSGNWENVPFHHNSPNSLMYFLIINVQNDEKVLSYIKENEKNFFKKKYYQIIGLRDMYCENYEKSASDLNKKLNIDIKENSNKEISKMENSSKIKIFFAIMETEAWFLAMYSLLEKLNCTLNAGYISNKLEFNIKNLNPEEIFRPSELIFEIYNLIGMKYDKSRSCIEALTKNINYEDYNIGINNGRCVHLEAFLNELLSYNLPLINN